MNNRKVVSVIMEYTEWEAIKKIAGAKNSTTSNYIRSLVKKVIERKKK